MSDAIGSKNRCETFSTEFFDWIRQSEFLVEKVESKKSFFDRVRKLDLGLSRKRPFSTRKIRLYKKWPYKCISFCPAYHMPAASK